MSFFYEMCASVSYFVDVIVYIGLVVILWTEPYIDTVGGGNRGVQCVGVLIILC